MRVLLQWHSSCFPECRSQFEGQSSVFQPSLFAAHVIRGRIAIRNSRPSWDNWYSTRGGISLKASRSTSPAFLSFCKVSDNDLGLIPFNLFSKSLNRRTLKLPRVFMMSSAHFLLITSIIPSIGQKH